MLRDNPREIRLRDYRPPAFLIDQTDLLFELSETQVLVTATLRMRRNPAVSRDDQPLRLDGELLELLSLSLDGRRLAADEYRLDDGGLMLHQVPDQFVLESVVRLLPQQNTALEGLYQSGGMFCTQCEAEGFRRITWFLDRPDVMSRFRTTIVAEHSRYPVLLSNGNLVEESILADGRHRVVWEDPFPKPSYLFALVAGDLGCLEDRYVTVSGRAVKLRIYVEHHNLDKCGHAMHSLKQAMAWDEQNYGREYDLDIYMIVAVSDFNMGAMENKGLNIFNAKYVLARPDTATDQDYQGIEGVIAHEYFHNWTGNRITCRDWFQLSLKEGLTVFRDQEFSADMGSRGVKRIDDVRLLRSHQFAEDASPMAHPVRPDSYIEINNFYTTTVYDKGAEVIRMQHRLLGPEAFRRGMDLYFQRHDGQAVTTDDFLGCMADASGRDLTQFATWYTQAGTPRIRTRGHYDSTTASYTLTVEQHTPPTPGQPVKQPLHLPFAMALLDEQGKEMALRLAGEEQAVMGTRMLELRQASQSFCFVDLPGKPLPSLLRGFSAPVKLLHDYSDEDLLFLMVHDSDGFNRWDAAQTLFVRMLLARVRNPESALHPNLFAALSGVLAAAQGDQALAAEILALPSQSYLGDQMDTVDVEGIQQAHRRTLTEIGEALGNDLLAAYRGGLRRKPVISRPVPSPGAACATAVWSISWRNVTQRLRRSA